MVGMGFRSRGFPVGKAKVSCRPPKEAEVVLWTLVYDVCLQVLELLHGACVKVLCEHIHFDVPGDRRYERFGFSEYFGVAVESAEFPRIPHAAYVHQVAVQGIPAEVLVDQGVVLTILFRITFEGDLYPEFLLQFQTGFFQHLRCRGMDRKIGDPECFGPVRIDRFVRGHRVVISSNRG